jgi:hypothetical protein
MRRLTWDELLPSSIRFGRVLGKSVVSLPLHDKIRLIAEIWTRFLVELRACWIVRSHNLDKLDTSWAVPSFAAYALSTTCTHMLLQRRGRRKDSGPETEIVCLAFPQHPACSRRCWSMPICFDCPATNSLHENLLYALGSPLIQEIK